MAQVAFARVVEGAEGPGQDHAQVVDLGDRSVFVVADGAGGTGGGAQAAALALRLVCERVADLGATSWLDLFADIDRSIAVSAHGGQTTLVVAVVDEVGVSGASVGDSGAWLVGATGVIDLTRAQRRKPLLAAAASRRRSRTA